MEDGASTKAEVETELLKEGLELVVDASSNSEVSEVNPTEHSKVGRKRGRGKIKATISKSTSGSGKKEETSREDGASTKAKAVPSEFNSNENKKRNKVPSSGRIRGAFQAGFPLKGKKKAIPSKAASGSEKKEEINMNDDASAISEISPMEPTREYLKDMLTCALCLDVYFEPVGTSCGHTFCRSCLGEALKRTANSCPVCRHPCLLDVAKVSPNNALSQMAKEIFPVEYANKAKECAAIEGEAPLIPLFWYNAPTFPGRKMKFCFFEPRYKLMCQRIIESGSMEFAYYSGKERTPKLDTVVYVLKVTRMELNQTNQTYEVECHCPFENSRRVLTDFFIEQGTDGLAMCRTRVLYDEPVPLPERASLRTRASYLKDKYDVALSFLSSKPELKDCWMSPPRQCLDEENLRGPEEISLFALGLAPATGTGLKQEEFFELLHCTSTADRINRMIEHYTDSDIDSNGVPTCDPEDDSDYTAYVRHLATLDPEMRRVFLDRIIYGNG